MKQKERIAVGVPANPPVLPVQRFDARLREGEQVGVAGLRLRRRIQVIGEQSEVQPGVAIGEEADLERLDQVFDALCVREHGRHHHQRAALRRDSRGEIQPRQRVRRRQQRCEPVHQRYRQLAGAQCGDDPERDEQPVMHAVGVRVVEQAPGETRGQQRD